MRKWTGDQCSGALLLTATVMSGVVMMHHPTAHLLTMHPDRGVWMNRLVHSLALIAMPIQMIGLLGLATRLRDFPVIHRAASTAQAFGLVAGMGAAVASGFVASAIIEAGPDKDATGQLNQLLHYTGWWNQGFAAVYVTASAVSILLWSIGFLRARTMPRPLAVTGVLIGLGVLVWQLIGIERLGVFQFGLIIAAEGVWMTWVGICLVRGGSSATVP